MKDRTTTLTDATDHSNTVTSADTTPTGKSEDVEQFNTVGLISFILTVVAGGLCAIMFYLANGLPNSPANFGDAATTPAQLRLLILACSTGLLATVAFVMGLIALLLPNPNKKMALLAVIGSTFILLGVFGVVILAIIMTNYQAAADTVTLLT